jgi:hypothetical protein
MPELTKSDKKILRAAIDIGLQKDFVTAITELDAVITQWKEKHLDKRDAYQSLNKTMKDNDKFIARRYDGLTGSRYSLLVCVLYTEGSVLDANLEGLSEETRNKIMHYKYLSDNH